MTLTDADINELQARAAVLRRVVMEVSWQAKAHHIGSAFSIVDLLVALYFRVLRIDPKLPGAPDRDRFLLSKGHACLAWYAALSLRGFFSREELLRNYGTDGGRLGLHPDAGAMPGVEVSSGSLGHGLSIGAGLSLAAKLDGLPYRTYVMVGDGECNEGSIWEAALFAAHHQLDNLVAIIDYNRWQSFGRTDAVMSLDPLPEKWRTFGWESIAIDGHNFREIIAAFDHAQSHPGKPTVIIAHTLKGKGWEKLEDTLESHYLLPTEDDLKSLP